MKKKPYIAWDIDAVISHLENFAWEFFQTQLELEREGDFDNAKLAERGVKNVEKTIRILRKMSALYSE